MALLQRLNRFCGDMAGVVSAFSLFLTVTLLMIGGLALDGSAVMTENVHLQAANDSTAHAALLTRETKSADEAKAKALDVAKANLPHTYYGDVVYLSDVVFGTWDASTRKFRADPTSSQAVRVQMHRADSSGNSYRTLLLWLTNMWKLDIQTASTYQSYNPMCFNEGFVSDGVVDIQSNNMFGDGFCIHSNTYVSINSNNTFEPGSVVSMPDLRNLQIPSSGLRTNLGLGAALRQGSYNIRVLNRINDIIAKVGDPTSSYYRPYITDPAPVDVAGSKIDATNLPPGHIYNWNCGGGSGTLDGSKGTISNVVIKTSCQVKFSANSAVENAAILTTSTDNKSFNGPSGVALGKNDNCANGGDVQLVSLGGMDFAANLEMYGSQLLGLGQIKFAARANGIQGASMVSRTGIDGTSNMHMGICGTGMENNFIAHYFRLVE